MPSTVDFISSARQSILSMLQPSRFNCFRLVLFQFVYWFHIVRVLVASWRVLLLCFIAFQCFFFELILNPLQWTNCERKVSIALILLVLRGEQPWDNLLVVSVRLYLGLRLWWCIVSHFCTWFYCNQYKCSLFCWKIEKGYATK